MKFLDFSMSVPSAHRRQVLDLLPKDLTRF